MAGSLAGPRAVALRYNIAHRYLTAALALLTSLPVALIWIAHIAIDRAIGYGLKYGERFKSAHLARR